VARRTGRHASRDRAVDSPAGLTWSGDAPGFGKRDPKQYGTITLEQIDARLRALGEELGVEVTSFESNDEGKICDRIHQAHAEQMDAVLINAGA
jgi:3-dehydroquinate dehydratase